MLLDLQDVECPVNETLADLDYSRLRFYLTGSRYFGCAGPDSDWDFMVQDGATARGTLAELDFSGDILFRSGYERDPLTFTEAVVEKTVGGVKVQVQIVKDIEVMRATRDILAGFLPEQHRVADRAERGRLWGGICRVIENRLGF